MSIQRAMLALVNAERLYNDSKVVSTPTATSLLIICLEEIGKVYISIDQEEHGSNQKGFPTDHIKKLEKVLKQPSQLYTVLELFDQLIPMLLKVSNHEMRQPLLIDEETAIMVHEFVRTYEEYKETIKKLKDLAKTLNSDILNRAKQAGLTYDVKESAEVFPQIYFIGSSFRDELSKFVDLLIKFTKLSLSGYLGTCEF